MFFTELKIKGMVLYGSMILGVLLVILGKLNKAFARPDFLWKLFIKNNLISTLMNIVAGLLLVINQKEIIALLTVILPNSAFTVGGLFAGISGMAGVTIIQFVIDMLTRDKKTVIGLNKE